MKSLLIPVSLLLLIFHSTSAQLTTVREPSSLSEEEVIERYLKQGAWRYRIFAPEWGMYIDSALALRPETAYLYQQRAMPYFKQKKYEAGMAYLDKAVELDPARYIDYRAFIKCIFSKRYHDALVDLEQSKKIKGEYGYVMDHSYDFYQGLCYLQLNAFEKAKTHFVRSLEHTLKIHGEAWQHHLDLFYLGVTLQELQDHEAAVEAFNKTLAQYPDFADAEYYKAISLYRLGKKESGMALMDKCRLDLRNGMTINEDNSFYEKYPYQIEPWHIEMVQGR